MYHIYCIKEKKCEKNKFRGIPILPHIYRNIYVIIIILSMGLILFMDDLLCVPKYKSDLHRIMTSEGNLLNVLATMLKKYL